LTPPAKNLVILGARQHAKVLVAIIRECYPQEFRIVGYLDDDPALAESCVLDLPVLGTIEDLEKISQIHNITHVVLGISNRFLKLRHDLFNRVKKLGLALPSLIHKTAFVSPFADIGEGVVLNPGVVVNAFAKIGNNVVVYSNSTIEHETCLGNNVYIGPGVNFTSNTSVGENTFIGAGSKIIPDIKIGSNVIVGAGSVIIADIPEGTTVAGVPAKIINSSRKSKI